MSCRNWASIVVLVQPSAYPTGLYSATQRPADPGRAREYGEVAALPSAFVQFLSGIFSSTEAPDAHDVAKELAKLIATPAGQRPDRVIVGAGYAPTRSTPPWGLSRRK